MMDIMCCLLTHLHQVLVIWQSVTGMLPCAWEGEAMEQQRLELEAFSHRWDSLWAAVTWHISCEAESAFQSGTAAQVTRRRNLELDGLQLLVRPSVLIFVWWEWRASRNTCVPWHAQRERSVKWANRCWLPLCLRNREALWKLSLSHPWCVSY